MVRTFEKGYPTIQLHQKSFSKSCSVHAQLPVHVFDRTWQQLALPKKRRLFVPKMVPEFQSKLPNVQISTLRVEVISLRRIDIGIHWEC